MNLESMILESKNLAQKEFQEPHDVEGRIVHLGLCQKSRLIRDVKWYNHKPKRAMENERVNILQMREQMGRTRIKESGRSIPGNNSQNCNLYVNVGE